MFLQETQKNSTGNFLNLIKYYDFNDIIVKKVSDPFYVKLGNLEYFFESQNHLTKRLPFYHKKRAVYEVVANSLYFDVNITTFKDFDIDTKNLIIKKFRNKDSYEYCKIIIENFHYKKILEIFWQIRYINDRQTFCCFKVLIVYGGIKYLKDSEIVEFYVDKHHKKFFPSKRKIELKYETRRYRKNLYLIKNIIDGFDARFSEMSLALFEPEFFFNNEYVIKYDKNYTIEVKEHNIISNIDQNGFDYMSFCIGCLNQHKLDFDYDTENLFKYQVNYENIRYNESEPYKTLFECGIKDLKPMDTNYNLNKTDRVLYQLKHSNNDKGKFCYLMFPKEEYHLISFLKQYNDLIEQINFYQEQNIHDFLPTNEKIFKIFIKDTINIYLKSLKPYQLFLTLLDIEKKPRENYFLFLFYFIECAFLHEEIVTLLDIRDYKQNIELIKKDLIDKDFKTMKHSMDVLENILDENSNVQVYFKIAENDLVCLLRKINYFSLHSPKSQNLNPTSFLLIKNY